MNRSMQQITPRGSSRKPTGVSTPINSPRTTWASKTPPTTPRKTDPVNLDRSILSKGVLRTSDAQGDLASLIRKGIICLNVVLSLTSLALIGMGIWMLLPTSHRLDLFKLQDSQIFLVLIILSLVSGAFFFVFSFLGYTIAIKLEHEFLLYAYGYVCVFLAGLSVIFVIITFSYGTQMSIILEMQLNRNFKDSYISETANNPVSVAWNTAQVKLECCGVRGYQDWRETSWYSSNSSTSELYSIGIFQKDFPASCCKLDEGTTDSYLESEKFRATNTELIRCYSPSEELAFVFKKGCFDEVLLIFETICYLTGSFQICLAIVMIAISACVYGISREYGRLTVGPAE